MKRFLLLTLLFLIVMAPLTLTAQTTVLKFNQDGQFASFNTSTFGSGVSFSVSANASTGSTATASINYLAFQFSPDFTTLTFTQIVGAIPASTFTGQNTNNINLNLDLSQLDPTAINQSCSVDLLQFIVTCGQAPTGTISLSFTQNGGQRTRILALGEEMTVGNFTTRIHQRSDSGSANYSGTILGTTVSGSDAKVGINHNSSLEFIKN